MQDMTSEHVKCLILGGGPAGFTAAIYASRAGLEPVLYEGIQPGGQLTTTTVVENFPGFPGGVDAMTLMDSMRRQAISFGAQVRQGTAIKAELSEKPFRITLDGGEVIEAESLIIATGATAKYLGLPSEEKYRGAGVSACAVCDGFFYRKRTVAVVGGGDSACEDALYLASLAQKVYMIVRRDVFRASKAMQDKVFASANIEILWNSQVEEVLGDGTAVAGLKLVRKDGSRSEIKVDGLFLAIGHHPNSEIFDVKVDEAGYIVTEGKTTQTSVQGVFAAGDVQDSRYRQAVTAAASGCMAARDAEKYLLKK
ncbi:MAG: thioredoxin-disulfide reductase [Bacteroidales bacterium]|nr:thioredoxin-disulfide reductase [Bacteroidales bacterium]